MILFISILFDFAVNLKTVLEINFQKRWIIDVGPHHPIEMDVELANANQDQIKCRWMANLFKWEIETMIETSKQTCGEREQSRAHTHGKNKKKKNGI